MQYSQTYAAAIISILGIILPLLGVNVDTQETTQAIGGLVSFLGLVWIIIRRFQAGGVTPLGARIAKQ